MLQNTASDLSMHCLHMSHKKELDLYGLITIQLKNETYQSFKRHLSLIYIYNYSQTSIIRNARDRRNLRIIGSANDRKREFSDIFRKSSDTFIERHCFARVCNFNLCFP